MQITLVLVLLIITMILFSLDLISFDVVALLAIVVLVAAGVLTTREAFAGFGNDFIIMLAAIFLIGSSLQHNGIIDYLSERTTRLKHIHPTLLMLVIMLVVGVISAFMNNTTVVAVFIAPVISICKKFNISPSKILMPMAFASLMGGTSTLIGTSTNVAGSAFMQSRGIAPLSMFELLPLGGVVLLVGIIYMAVIGRHLLPGHMPGLASAFEDKRIFDAEVVATGDSLLIGKTAEQVQKESGNVEITAVHRKSPSGQEHRIAGDDILIVRGTKDELLKFCNQQHVRIKKSSEHEKEANLKLAEIMVLPSSYLLNSSLGESYFQQQNRVSVLAVHRKESFVDRRLKDIKMKVGDILLVEGTNENLSLIRKRSNFIIISETAKTNFASLRKGWLTLLIFILAITAGSFNLVPISIALLVTAIIVAMMKAIPSDGLYTVIDWRLIILIGGMTAFGTALQKTGADRMLAETILETLTPYGKYAILAGFMLLTTLLTQPMSNAAAALVVLPVAIQTAEMMQLPPRTFCIAIIASASISMIAPFEPCSLLVYSPGKYRIRDFLKTGGLLTIISLLLLLWLIPLIWGF